MSDVEDPEASQQAASHPRPLEQTPRPRKRLKSSHTLHDGQFDLTQISPNKPPRLPRTTRLPVPIAFPPEEDTGNQTNSVMGIFRGLWNRIGTAAGSAWRASSGSLPLSGHEAKEADQESRDESCRDDRNKNRTAEGNDCNTESAAEAVGRAEVGLPDDFDYPSPPPSSEEAPKEEQQRPQQIMSNDNGKEALEVNAEAPKANNRKGLPTLIESFDPPQLSNDSAYFSFSKQDAASNKVTTEVAAAHENVGENLDEADAAHVEKTQEQNGETEAAQKGESRLRSRYYTRTFEYVLREVTKRFDNVLSQEDVNLASCMREDISSHGLALFARLYRRKPSWHRVVDLVNSYAPEIDVERAVTDLCKHGLLSSSHYAMKAVHSKRIGVLIAKGIIGSLRSDELKAVCNSLPDGEALKKLGRRKLLPVLQEKFVEDSRRKQKEKRFRQTTLTGLSPQEALMKAVLKTAGHCVIIPDHVLISLERIHFLFFLDDGHDSPNVILADTRKVVFPQYECRPERAVFTSAIAYDAFQDAIDMESRLSAALEQKEYNDASHIGSLAEVELREYLFLSSPRSEMWDKVGRVGDRRLACEGRTLSNGAGTGSAQTPTTKRTLRRQTAEGLTHPFFRRYTAPWVYARMVWHSVHALERLSEYETAVQRLELLLSSGLMSNRRGKWLNRLTINMFKHLQMLEKPLEIILEALGDDARKLEFGDQMDLAKRGAAIHRKLTLPDARRQARSLPDKKAKDVKIEADAIVRNSQPEVLSKALSRASTKIRIRKIFGKSVQVLKRERFRQGLPEKRDPWMSFRDEDSRGSLKSLSTSEPSTMGKASFKSLGTSGKSLSVETYCIQWYLGKEGWNGIHDEGSSVRFLFTLLLWEPALFAPVDDVFQTPYQDRPLDLFTEVFYTSRKDAIESRLEEIRNMSPVELRDIVLQLYKKYENIRAVGCRWSDYSGEVLSEIAAGLGGKVVAHCLRLLSQNFTYWGGGFPDLTLWKVNDDSDQVFETKIVEVKSARDVLSEKQRAWLVELEGQGADCEVCKVVEKATEKNMSQLEASTLDSVEIGAIDAAEAEDDDGQDSE